MSHPDYMTFGRMQRGVFPPTVEALAPGFHLRGRGRRNEGKSFISPPLLDTEHALWS